jgi:hypothetical protein
MTSDTTSSTLACVRIYSDAQGISHISDEEIPLIQPDAARSTHFTRVKTIAFRILPAGMFRDWHPTPLRQFVIINSGIVEVGTADGQVRQTGPGSVTLLEDTEGKGHTTRVIGNTPAIVAFIPLASE